MHTPVPLNQTEIFSLLSFDEQQQQQQHIHTSQSIESIQEDQTIFPFFYCGPTPVYEIYSKEYITELAKELFSLCEQKYAENILEEKKQEPIYILEAGCGDCRLSLYLYNELKNILQKENQKINGINNLQIYLFYNSFYFIEGTFSSFIYSIKKKKTNHFIFKSVLFSLRKNVSYVLLL